MPGLGGKVLEKAGGSPILLAGNELYTGLERGVIDATEWIGPYHDYKMGFYQIAKYYYTPGWHETGAILEFFINKDRFEELPSDLQSIVRHAAARINHWMLSEFEAKNAYYLKLMVNEHGVKLRQFPKDVLSTFRKHTKEVIEELVDSDPFSKRVYESYSKFQKEINYWSEHTEKPFYNQLMDQKPIN
jgi:TRAP-type mannitol/chloroaromatic compound transport system substrate-binding protein